MSDSSAVLDPDRLPWLADETPLQQRRSRRPALTSVAALAVLLLAGLSFLMGLFGADLLRPQPQAAVGNAPTRRISLPAADQLLPAMPVPPAPVDQSPTGAPLPLQPAALPNAVAPPLPNGTRSMLPATTASGGERKAAEEGCREGESGGRCGTADLGALDRHLGLLYSQAWSKADAGRRGLLLRSHDRFVTRLDGCGSSDCKSDAYLARMREIDEIASGQPREKQALVSSAGLAALDRHLGSLYGQSWERADTDQRGVLLQSQDRFVDKLETCRSNACKAQVYLSRMREVSEIMGAREQAVIAANAR